METDIPMPKVGELMEEAVVVEWLVNEGDQVEKYQAMALIETDKVEVEIEFPVSGMVTRLVVAAGEQAKVGQTICTVRTDG